MTSIAQNGIFGFGPQPAKGTFAHEATVPVIYRHRAANINLNGLDGSALGPSEVGGIPVPTFPYKSGQLVTGGASLYPRLSNYFGWLLEGALGDVSTVAPVASKTILPSTTLTASAQPGFTTGLVTTSLPSTVMLRGVPAGATLTGNVVVTGTDNADAAQTETLALNGAFVVNGSKTFKTITSVDLPARVTASDAVIIYASDMWEHTFKFKTAEGLQAWIPWMSFYKYIPGDQSAADPTLTDMYEQFRDCKITSLVFTLPNDGPIACRVDALGRMWHYTDTKPVKSAAPVDWTNAFESYKSIPIGSHSSGYMKIPTFSNDELPIIGAQVTLANIPLRLQDERVYGSNMLDDVTIVSRAVSIDLVMKWRDPTLYKLIQTGSTTGTDWAEKPFVQSVDILSASNDAPFGSSPWTLGIKAPQVLFQVNGGIDLVANQSVMMRLTGTALAPEDGSDYAQFILKNQNPSYAWPSA